MMKKKNSIIFAFIILFLSLTAQSKSLKKDYLVETNNLYEKSQEELRKKNFDDAISILKKIKKYNNVVNIPNDKIQMNLIYAYYQQLDFNQAQKNIQEFMRMYPNHPNIDYIIYIKCLISMSLDKNTFLNFLPVNYNKNNYFYAENAFFQLKYFINRYPQSHYVVNAKKNLIYLKNRLSQHDLEILKFYFAHQEYTAVVNRGEEMLQKYSETPSAREALIYMEKSYNALKIFETAKKIKKIILLNKINI